MPTAVSALRSFPGGWIIHLECVQIIRCPGSASANFCSFAFHPQPVFEDHVNASHAAAA
jgi:hypothetical protein